MPERTTSRPDQFSATKDAEAPGQNAAPKVELLHVVHHRLGGHGDPVIVLEPERQGLPVRKIDHALVLDVPARDIDTEAVEDPGCVRPGVVDRVGA